MATTYNNLEIDALSFEELVPFTEGNYSHRAVHFSLEVTPGELYIGQRGYHILLHPGSSGDILFYHYKGGQRQIAFKPVIFPEGVTLLQVPLQFLRQYIFTKEGSY